jgi:hypothetical protein
MDLSNHGNDLEQLHIPAEAETRESDHHRASQSSSSTTQNPQNSADVEYSTEGGSPSISPDSVDYVSYPDIEVDTDVSILTSTEKRRH